MSRGIISGLCKGVKGRDDIQTDAAINPGNSGGALVDLQGRIVGMPTYIITRGGGNDGCNFAIPINRIKQVVGRLLKEAKDPSFISKHLFLNFL
jgi:serine protease Do